VAASCLRDNDIGAFLACASVCTWQMILHPAALIRPVGSPKGSITAAGLALSGASSAAGFCSVMEPTPTRAFPASLNSLRIVVA